MAAGSSEGGTVNINAEKYLGKLVIARTAQGEFKFIGKCISICDAPTIGINLRDGERAHWRVDMVEVVDLPKEAIDALLEPESVREEPQPRKLSWADETVMMINKLTPLIVGKAFDPDWFLLYQRLREFEQGAAVPVSEGVTQRALSKALFTYGKHKHPCLAQGAFGANPCICGLRDLLQSLSSGPKESA